MGEPNQAVRCMLKPAVGCLVKRVAIANAAVLARALDPGRDLLGTPIEAPAYPGSKNYFLLEEELESPSLLRAALEVTESAVPLPKPKAKAGSRTVGTKALGKRKKPTRAA